MLVWHGRWWWRWSLMMMMDDDDAHVNGLFIGIQTWNAICYMAHNEAKLYLQIRTSTYYIVCQAPIWWCSFIAQCGLWLRFTVFTMSNVDGDINIYVVYCSFNFICCHYIVSTWVCVICAVCVCVLFNFLHLIYAISWRLIFVLLLYVCVVFHVPRSKLFDTHTYDERSSYSRKR